MKPNNDETPEYEYLFKMIPPYIDERFNVYPYLKNYDVIEENFYARSVEIRERLGI